MAGVGSLPKVKMREFTTKRGKISSFLCKWNLVREVGEGREEATGHTHTHLPTATTHHTATAMVGIVWGL